MYEQDDTERDIDTFEDEPDLVNVDGTKVKLSGKVLKVMILRSVYRYSKHAFWL